MTPIVQMTMTIVTGKSPVGTKCLQNPAKENLPKLRRSDIPARGITLLQSFEILLLTCSINIMPLRSVGESHCFRFYNIRLARCYLFNSSSLSALVSESPAHDSPAVALFRM